MSLTGTGQIIAKPTFGMKLAFFCNYLNHHQVNVADELYSLLGDDFRFVTTMPRNDSQLKGGEDYSCRPYCLMATESEPNRQMALALARMSETCVFGSNSEIFAVERAKYNPSGVSLEIGERRLKKGLINILSPRFLKWRRLYSTYFRKANFYKLCASGFAAEDDRRLGCYNGRHYKWGYFTKLTPFKDQTTRSSEDPLRIMWCGRFIRLKMPELPLKMTKKLKDEGYDNLILDYYGNGPEEDAVIRLADELGLSESVQFHGAHSNAEIRSEMQQHDIFLFTSNRLEGWGAVANEAMDAGCVLIASRDIGSSPFLINDGVNGFTFATASVNDLSDKVKNLLQNREMMEQIKLNARSTISSLWCPANAARSLLRLIDDLQNGRESSISEGPCSKA